MAGINFIDGGEFTPPLKFRTEIEKSCSGERYNFKKGFEYCENIEKCKVRIPTLRKNSKKFKKEADRFNLRGFK